MVLASAADALRHSASYHVSGMLDPGLTVDLVVTPKGWNGHLGSHGVEWDEVGVGSQTWLRGRQLWQATLGADRAAAFGDSWVLDVDAQAAFGFAGPLRNLETRIPGVVFGRHAGLTNRGFKQVAGQRVIELASSRDIYDVRAEGTPYPVRWLELDRPGAGGQPCGITLDRFDDPARIEMPVTDLSV